MPEGKEWGSTASDDEGAEKVERTPWAFWLEWVSVTVVGSVIISILAFALTKLLGHVGLDQGDSSTEYLVVLPAASLSVGLMQWLVLRRQVRRAGWWIVAAAVTSAVSGLLLGNPGPPSYPAPYWTHLLLGLPVSMLLGSILAGLAQWLCLRRQARRPGLYIAASAIGWGVALVVAALAFNWTLSIGMGPALTVWGVVCGVVYGAITASMLMVLLQNPRGSGPRSLLVAGGTVTFVLALMIVHILGTTMTAEKLVRQYQAGKRDFSGANLRQANLPQVDLRWAILHRADLCEANLKEADLKEVDLTTANLSYADLSGADLSGADLRGASLRGARLNLASLRAADLGFVADPTNPCPEGSAVASQPSLFEPLVCHTDLRDADLRGADLSDADLSSAWLQGAKLEGAILYNADLRGAIVTDEQLTQVQSLEGATLPDGTKHD